MTRQTTRKKKMIEDALPESLTPVGIDALLQPPRLPMPPQGGRPPRNQLDVLGRELSKSREYYLANADAEFLKNLLHDVPLKCTEHCPLWEGCVVPEAARPADMEGKHPEYGDRCPTETDMALRLFHGYLVELDIDIGRPTEVQTVADLVGLQILKRRATIELTTMGSMVAQDVGAKGDNILRRLEKNPLWDVRKDLERREEKIMGEFLATRKEAIKAEAASMASGKKTVAEWLAGLEPAEITVVEPKRLAKPMTEDEE